MFKLNCVEK